MMLTAHTRCFWWLFWAKLKRCCGDRNLPKVISPLQLGELCLLLWTPLGIGKRAGLQTKLWAYPSQTWGFSPPVFTCFPLFKKGGFCSPSSGPSHWLKSGPTQLSHSMGLLDPVTGQKGTPQQAPPCHPHWRAAVYGVPKDIKLPGCWKQVIVSSGTHHLLNNMFRHTQGFESTAWVWDSLQNETKRAPALKKPLGCQNRWLLTQTTDQVLLGELPPSQIKLQPLVFVQTSIHAI